MKIVSEKVEKWGVFEFELTSGKIFEKPFEDVELLVYFKINSTVKKVNGFYDGGLKWKVRFMPEETGKYEFRTESNYKDFDELEGSFISIEPSPDNHGPVKVDKKYHFSYKDGMPCFVMGTTVYAWTYRPEEVRKKTLENIGKYNFNKVRMAVFPFYQVADWFNEVDISYEPPVLPYKGENYNFNYKDFNIEYFKNFEDRVMELQKMGVQADVILFHNYDYGKWGIDDGMTDDDALFYLKYLIARISSYRNVWWSLANEYDMVQIKPSGMKSVYDRRDWDRIGNYIMEHDPYGHPRSMHEWFSIYPDREWMTHVSCQKPNTYSLPIELRQIYQKPVIMDEYEYEGNLSYGWGNLSGKEELMRHWLSVMAGVYATHGECYVINGNRVDPFWTNGGTIVGESAPRLKYMKEIAEGLPYQEMRPRHEFADGRDKLCLSKDYDVYLYLVMENASDRWISFGAPDGIGRRYEVTIFDVWNCRILDRVSNAGSYDASKIPGFIAIKAVLID